MTYDYFIGALQASQTQRVHTLPLPESCSPSQIPESFAPLFSDLISLLEQHIDKLCRKNQRIGIFGLQPTSCAPTSTAPLQLRRIMYPHQPNAHFCCSLAWLKLHSTSTIKPADWRKAKHVIVDFTTGIVMDEQHCLHHVLDNKHPGTIYGRLPKSKLTAAWAHITRETSSC